LLIPIRKIFHGFPPFYCQDSKKLASDILSIFEK
jgi:hypothetical protein